MSSRGRNTRGQRTTTKTTPVKPELTMALEQFVQKFSTEQDLEVAITFLTKTLEGLHQVETEVVPEKKEKLFDMDKLTNAITDVFKKKDKKDKKEPQEVSA